MVGLPKGWDDPPRRPTIREMFNSVDFSSLPFIGKRKEPPMDRATELRSIAKDFGVTKLAALIVTDGNAHSITEHELTKLIDDEAQKTRTAGERPETAFARFYSAPENVELRKAVQVAKSFPPLLDLQPTQVGGADATDVNNDSSKAYEQLTTMADELRRRSPTLTAAKAFSLVFEDQANATLAAAAHKRPSATTSFAFPR